MAVIPEAQLRYEATAISKRNTPVIPAQAALRVAIHHIHHLTVIQLHYSNCFIVAQRIIHASGNDDSTKRCLWTTDQHQNSSTAVIPAQAGIQLNNLRCEPSDTPVCRVRECCCTRLTVGNEQMRIRDRVSCALCFQADQWSDKSTVSCRNHALLNRQSNALSG